MDGQIRKVAVVGTGILGTQIAILSASFGYEVSVYDPDERSFRKSLGELAEHIRVAGGKTVFETVDWERDIRKVTSYQTMEQAVRDADLVIEAVPERLDLKRKVFAELDTLTPPWTILATNSSSIPISRIEGATSRPELCLNTHFYFPAAGINIVDIMRGAKTSPATSAAADKWVKSIGCIPMVVKKEIFGFCFNRIWREIKRTALYMWAGGYVDFEDIDRSYMISVGVSQGPFGRMDAVGLDTVYNIEMVYYNESKDPKDQPPDALKAMIDRGDLGIKTGKGFYSYPDPEYARPGFLRSGTLTP